MALAAGWDERVRHIPVLVDGAVFCLMPYRVGQSTGHLLGLIAFLVQHDSYHIGQIGFLRRQLGKPALAYTRGARAG